MNSLVVLMAVVAAASCSVVQLAQPAHFPAVVLDPHGRPLDTAEVINARALHLQAKALEHSAPLYPAALYSAAPALYSSPLHLLKKRSLAYAAYAPVVSHSVYAAPAAVSHQSRVDYRASPALVSHAVAAPVVSHAVYAAPAAVSHQSRVDYHSSPALLSHAVAPLSYSALVSPYSHSHYLKKRSLASVYGAWSHAVPAAVSHQSRVDYRASPALVSHAVAAPVLSHAVYAAPAAVSHQSRVDVISEPAHVALAPLAHSAVWTSPLAHSAHASLW